MAEIPIPRTMPSAGAITKVQLEKARVLYSALKKHLNQIPSWGLVDDKDLDLFFTQPASGEDAKNYMDIHEKVSYKKERLV